MKHGIKRTFVDCGAKTLVIVVRFPNIQDLSFEARAAELSTAGLHGFNSGV